MSPNTRPIRFGDFAAHLQSQELFRHGVLVRMPNQSFVALATLLERPGELVTREELRVRLWPDNRVVEFEQGLNAIINRLRDALGDSAEQPKYIETLPRRGYRFAGTIIEDSAATSEEAPRPARTARRRAWVAGASIAALLLIGAFWATRWSGGEPARIGNAKPLTTLLGQERMPALSPDGKSVAFAWNADGSGTNDFDLYVKALGSERLTRLTRDPAIAISAAWSPDGSQLAFARMSATSRGLFVVPATGGPERALEAASFAQETLMTPAWSPDGTTLAYAARDPTGAQIVRLYDIATQTSRALTPAPACWHAGAPAWVSAGKLLAFLCMTSVAVHEVYLADPAATTAPRALARIQGFAQGLAWEHSSKRLLIANDAGAGSGTWELELDGKLHAPRVFEESLGPGLSARDGSVVFTRAREVIDIWHLTLGDATRREPPRKWIYSTRAQLTPDYSPDGARIAFQSNRSGSPEIWLADADGGNAVRLTTFNGPLTGGPKWCSDGRRLAFDSRESGVSAIYVMDTLERVPRRVATSRTNLALPVWSADCQWLLASDGRQALYRVPADGGDAQRFTTQRSYQAAVVGERVVFNVAGPAGVALWSKPLAGGEEAPLPGMPALAYADGWAANVHGIFFTDGKQSPAAVNRYDFAGGSTQTIALLPNLPTPLGGLGLAISRDGKSLLYTHTEEIQSDLVLATTGN